MSTKASIRYESDDATQTGFHLYREAFDEENVYLEVTGFHFEASTLPDLTWDEGGPRVLIRFPEDWARRLRLIEPENG